ncbi:hypothetical protein [Streptomyces mutomycini]|uniref:hypothetical protein n=1 Tax=Streptomyces mutomycini TaxID=284036 RepID=UPI0033F661BA
MSYGTLEYYKERADYWRVQLGVSNRRAEAAIAEAKKSKERQLTAIRMLLELKKRPDGSEKHKDLLNRVSELHEKLTYPYAINGSREVCSSCVDGHAAHAWPCPTAEVLEELKND